MTRWTEVPVLGRPSTAATEAPLLRREASAATAAFRADGGDSEWCSVRAASVVGVRHRLAGEAGEDNFAWSWTDERITLAVADGLGSIAGSACAARRASEAAVAFGTLQEAFEAANRAAGGGGASTLLVAVADRGGRVDVGRVGDSTAFLVRSGDAWEELFDLPDDERVTTQTEALPGDYEVETATVTLAAGEMLALVTDGVADPWRDGPTTVAPTIAEALQESPSALELAQLANFSRQGCHDDRTIVALWLSR